MRHTYAIVATVYVVVTTAISLTSIVLGLMTLVTVTATLVAATFLWLGIFIAAFAIAAFIDWGLSWLAGDEFDATSELLAAITNLIVSYENYTEVSGLYFEGLESVFSSGGTLLKGATLTLSDEFYGSIERVKGDGDSQLNQSDTYAWLEADASGGSTSFVTRQGNSRCRIVDLPYFEGKSCENSLEAEFTFGNAGINKTIKLLYKIYAKTRYQKCGVAGTNCHRKTNHMTLPNDLKRGWDWAEIQVVVLPDSLDGLWTWAALSNRDRDG